MRTPVNSVATPPPTVSPATLVGAARRGVLAVVPILAVLAVLALTGCADATLKADPGTNRLVANGTLDAGFPGGPGTDWGLSDGGDPATGTGNAPGHPPQVGGPQTQPPPPLVFQVTEPPRGARLFGPTIHVAGTLTGGSAPVLTVAGTPVTPDATGTFAADVPARGGLNMLITTVSDGNDAREDRRAVLQDADADPSSPVENGAAVMVGASGFPKISKLLTDYLGDMDLASLATANIPDNVQIDDLRYDRVDVQLIPQEGQIEVRLAVYGLHVELGADVSVGVTLHVSGSADADPALIVGHLTAQATPEGGLALDLVDSAVDLQNFGYDINGVPDFIEGWFNGMVRDLAENTIRDALNGFVIPSLFDPSALTRTVELLGHSIDVGLLLGRVEVHNSGLQLWADTTARADAVVHPGDAVRPEGGTPRLDSGIDLDVAAAADLASRVLHAAWAAGALDITLDENSGFQSPVPLTLALLAANLGDAAQGIDRTQPLILALHPLLPPVARVEPGDHPLVIETGDMMLDIATPNEGTLVTVALHLIARATFDIDTLANGGSIELTPDLQVEVHADVAETPRGAVREPQLELFVQTLAGALPGLVAGQTFAFGTDALPVPVTLVNPELTTDPQASYLHLRAGIGD